MKKYKLETTRKNLIGWDRFDEEFKEDGGNYRVFQCRNDVCRNSLYYILISDILYRPAIRGGYFVKKNTSSEWKAISRHISINKTKRMGSHRDYRDQYSYLVAACDSMKAVHAELEKIHRAAKDPRVVTVWQAIANQRQEKIRMKKYKFVVYRNQNIGWDQLNESLRDTGDEFCIVDTRNISRCKGNFRLIIMPELMGDAELAGYRNIFRADAIKTDFLFFQTFESLGEAKKELEKIFQFANTPLNITIYGDWSKIEKKEK